MPFFVNCADFTSIPRNSVTRVPHGRKDYSVCYVAEGEMLFALDGKREERVGAEGFVSETAPSGGAVLTLRA